MFGHHKAKRAKKKLKAEQSAFNQEKNQLAQNEPQREADLLAQQKKTASENAAQSKLDRQTAREEGRADTESFLRKDYSGLGLDPKVKEAMQYEANKAVQRGHQAANRKLLGEQSQSGILGKGGVGYAQQRDLMKMADEAQAGVNRDLTKLDKDLELKKMAAIYAGGEGQASQSQLDKQLALDELQLAEEKRRARNWEDKFNQAFSRI